MANEQAPRKRSTFRFLLTGILVISGIVALFLFMTGGFGDSYKFTSSSDYVTALLNDKTSTKDNVVSVKETTIEDSVTILTGTYYNKKGKKVSYKFTLNAKAFASEQIEYSYFNYETNAKDTTNPTTILKLIEEQDSKNVGLEKPLFEYTVANAYETNFWDQWGPTIITTGVTILIAIFLFSRLMGSVASNNKALDFNKSRAKREKKSKVRFDDVAGADEEKAEMQELVEYLKNPKKFSTFGAKLPKGVLLVGNPGCGKTLLAKAVAGEAGVPFYSISGSDFVEMFVGVGAGRVRDMFKTAKENAPCLIFIDEIDAVGRQRGAGLGGGNDEREQTLNQLLVEMDGFSDNAGIIVIAATNRDDVLDPALLRAGRFDRKITVSLPDKAGREAIFKVHARNKKLSADVDFSALAKRTVGFSGADIENILNEAAILAVRRNLECIGMDEIDEAIDRRVAGPAKSSRSLNPHEKEVVAYHEAGHAIIGLKYPHSDKVQKITIIPRGNTGGHVRMTPEEDRFLYTKKELEARIVGYLGGRSSEETFFDDVTSGASNDIEVATQIARMMVTELGMSSLGPIQYERDTGSVFLGRDYANTQKNFSIDTATKIDAEICKIIEESHKIALQIINDNKEDVILIAKTLIEHEQITAEEIDYLLEHRHLKRDEKPEEVTPVVETPVATEETNKGEE